jgi:hypothetical protein
VITKTKVSTATVRASMWPRARPRDAITSENSLICERLTAGSRLVRSPQRVA